MFIDINDIGPAGLSFDRRLDVNDLDGPSGEPIPVPGARVAGRMTRGQRGVDLTGRFEARVQLLCSRCAEPFSVDLASDFFLTLVPDPVVLAPGVTKMNKEDVPLFQAPDGQLDLMGVIAEQIYLNLPLKPICTEGCQGLCPVCGTDLNRKTCTCREDEIDPRLAPLLDFKKEPREF